MSLRAESVSVSFAERRVLVELSARFPPGTVTAIVGPNGAGKTTLLRTLLGAIRPSEGRVTLDGRPITHLSARQRARHIAYIPHSPGVSFAFSVEQVVRFGMFAASASPGARVPDRIAEALDRVELADRASEPFGVLSAGQRQRATLARALVQLAGGCTDETSETRMLLADEPVSAMDPRHAIAAMSACRALAADGVGVVMVVHDLTLAGRFADRVLVLDGAGRPVADAPPSDALSPEILARVFSTPFTRIAVPGGGEAILPGLEPPTRATAPASRGVEP